MPAGPVAYKFFGRTTERKQLIERLRAGLNTAVVGPAGLGKTALAADALADVVGANAANLATSPFPDGLVYLDLYAFHGQADPAWNTLANRICDAEFMERSPPRERAAEACRVRRILVIIEGGEEADGSAGRVTIPELLSVLSQEGRWLLLTRLSTQAAMVQTVDIKEPLHPEDAARLLDWLTERRPLDPDVRNTVLELLDGHPLALNWAGNLLARDEEDPADLARDWRTGGLPKLSDPRQADRTLRWLFDRSARGLDNTARGVLVAAGLLAHAPFPPGLIAAAIHGMDAGRPDNERALGALKALAQSGLLRRTEKYWQFAHVHKAEEPFWRSQHCVLIVDQGDVLRDQGDLAGALTAYRESLAVRRRLAEADPSNAGWQRDLSFSLTRLAEFHEQRGEVASGLALAQESLSIDERLSTLDPTNLTWQRDVAVSRALVARLHGGTR